MKRLQAYISITLLAILIIAAAVLCISGIIYNSELYGWLALAALIAVFICAIWVADATTIQGDNEDE